MTHSLEQLPIGLEIHHDMLGWYIVDVEVEWWDEGGFDAEGISLGFDGRQHYATEAGALRAALAGVEG